MAPTVTFVTQPPATVVSGEPLGTVVVNVKDANAANAPGASVAMTLTDADEATALPMEMHGRPQRDDDHRRLATDEQRQRHVLQSIVHGARPTSR